MGWALVRCKVIPGLHVINETSRVCLNFGKSSWKLAITLIWDESLHVRRVHALALDSIPSILKFSDWGKTSFTVEFLNRDGWSLESVLFHEENKL